MMLHTYNQCPYNVRTHYPYILIVSEIQPEQDFLVHGHKVKGQIKATS